MENKIKTRTVTLGNDARVKIIKGAKIVYDAVASTYSPLSGNVAIENQFSDRHVVTHDGVTVAKAITLDDPVENIGARMLVNASMKTNDVAGDGTSATVILAYHVLEKANKRIAAGFNPMLMRKSIEFAANEAKEYVEGIGVQVEGKQLRDVAQVSVGDANLGKLIADTIEEIGVNGGVTVEEYQGVGVESDVVEGFHFNRGFDSPYYMTSEAETAAYDNCRVLIVEEKVTTLSLLENVLEEVANSDNNRLLIIGDVSGSALQNLVVNKLKGTLQVVSVKPAVFGDQKQNHLEDLALLTGATVVINGTPSSEITSEHLGTATKVEVKKDSTTIVAERDKAVKARIKTLQKQIDDEDNQFRKTNMKSRLAMLEGKIAVIRVGGENETVAKEKKFRVDDAVHATIAARDSGIVPGGATSLVKAAGFLQSTADTAKHYGESYEGIRIVIEALEEPFKQLMRNGGFSDQAKLSQVRGADFGFGFNVLDMTDEPLSLFDNGVVDPVLVIKQVIENGCAAAALALTNNATITFADDNGTD